ncbi:hypothetical protein ACFVHB_28585 [Kitasatospora sp. NPDC127111]|uniref:hypothetical protein n=1 Tax=Kitasatospora sp. NPDC127111 TaxID=3345363 RepID=UPI003642A647
MTGGGLLRIRPCPPESVTFDGDPKHAPSQELQQQLADTLLHAVGRALDRLDETGLQVITAPATLATEPLEARPTADGGRALFAFALSEEQVTATTGQTAGATTAARPAAQRTRGVPPEKRRPAPARTTKAHRVTSFRVQVDHAMGPDELLRTFVRQYYRTTSEQEVDRLLPLWHWQRPPGRSVSVEEADRHFIDLPVIDVTQAALATLSETEQERINAEADARFWQETGLAPGTKLGTGPEDAARRARWRAAQAAVTAEHQLTRELDALPEDVREILFAGDRPLTALEDLRAALRLGLRLSALTPAQRADYLGRINTTASWAALDTSIDRFLAGERIRAIETAETDAAAATLFGCEDLYRLWKARDEAAGKVRQAGPYIGYSPGLLEESAQARTRFEAALKQHDFADEAAFLAAIEAYLLRFRAAAVTLALDVLAHYEHLFHEERTKLRTPGYVETMVTDIAKTTARADFTAAAASEAIATNLEVAAAASEAPDYPLEALSYRAEAKALRASADQAVVAAAKGDPFVDPERLGRDTDRAKLAELDATTARQYLLEVVDARQTDTASVRQELVADPERVFSLPDLVEATKKSQGAGAGTIYGWIVDDHVTALGDAHILSAAVQTIIALVLAALVPVGGWIAAAALIANAGLSIYQASEAITSYRQEAAEFRLAFSTNEPSLVWVGIAVAAAALDLHTSAAQLLRSSAKGLSALSGPLHEFAAAADAESAAARFRTLTAKIDRVEGLELRLREALKAQAAAELGLKRVVGEFAGRLHGGFLVDPTGPLKGMYYAIKKGVNTITKLRSDAKMLALLGDVTKLAGAERAEITAAFEQMKRIVSLSEQRGMDEATAMRFIDRLAAERSAGEGAFKKLVDDMEAWRPPADEPVRITAAHAGGAYGEHDLPFELGRRDMNMLVSSSGPGAHQLTGHGADAVALHRATGEIWVIDNKATGRLGMLEGRKATALIRNLRPTLEEVVTTVRGMPEFPAQADVVRRLEAALEAVRAGKPTPEQLAARLDELGVKLKVTNAGGYGHGARNLPPYVQYEDLVGDAVRAKRLEDVQKAVGKGTPTGRPRSHKATEAARGRVGGTPSRQPVPGGQPKPEPER